MRVTADFVPGAYRAPGLSESELAFVQELTETVFPPDLCELLSVTLPTGKGFPDWRGRAADEMREWREWLIGTIHFDVLNNGFWLADWGDRPDDPRESLAVVAQALLQAPALVPVYAHRAIPNEPLVAGNPVFSVWQTDVIIYGLDLADYFAHEFNEPNERRVDRASSCPRTIRFWSHIVDLNAAPPA